MAGSPSIPPATFDYADAEPLWGLVADDSGNLYGVTQGDGVSFGSVYEIQP
jgi:hypothetical protein